MSWIDERAKFQERFDKLSQENIQSLITELNRTTASYISKGGVSKDPNNNPDYNKVLQLNQKADSIKKRYTELNNDIIKYLENSSRDSDLSGILSENGELQKHIQKLEKIQNEMKIDVESAIARDELLRSRNTDVSRHKLFILGRPIRKGLIPYIWLISILFIGIGLIIFKMSAPQLPEASQTSVSIFFLIYSFFMDKRILLALLVASLIVILFLGLKVAGVFGK